MNQSKRCRKCDEVKTLEDFYKRSDSPDGRRSICRTCHSQAVTARQAKLYATDPEFRARREQYSRRYRSENSEKVSRDAANYYAANRERILKRMADDRVANPEKYRERGASWRAERGDYIREYMANYYLMNRERVAKRVAEWNAQNPESARNRAARFRAAHPERSRIDGQRRRARKADVPHVTYTAEQVVSRFAMFGNNCWMCMDPADCIDHVKPISRGGADMLANLRPACRSCNSAKRDRWHGPTQLHVFTR